MKLLNNKYSFVVVMETGKLVLWTGVADDNEHGEGQAIAYATDKHCCQVWDIAERPIPVRIE